MTEQNKTNQILVHRKEAVKNDFLIFHSPLCFYSKFTYFAIIYLESLLFL